MTANISEIQWQEATGNSMSPYLRAGDRLVVKDVPSGRIKVGDVIVFLGSGKGTHVCHRVCRIRVIAGEIVFTTKGDNAPRADEPIRASQMLGKVVTVCRNGRFLSPGVGRLTFLALWLRSNARRFKKTI